MGIKLLIEGQEEVGSPLEEGYPSEHPEVFQADAIIVADGGSIRAGDPSLTVSLRGDARVTVEVRTLASNKHAGQYGGAAPDALVVLLRALASLYDESGTWPWRACGGRNGAASRTPPTRSSGRSPRSRTTCPSWAPGASARGSGRGRRSR